MAKEFMSQDLTKCSCCGKMVPINKIELFYRKPDSIASMSTEEINAQCAYTDDYYVCDEEYFYIRCVIPLPIQGREENYSIGAWAQVSSNSFNKIWDLWEDDEQANEPPMKGLLANEVHLNTGVENTEIEVQLTGQQTRPKITIIDPECSLHHEQQNGISMHRASEYSDLCR